jgi:putative FmdB family regulatory protein
MQVRRHRPRLICRGPKGNIQRLNYRTRQAMPIYEYTCNSCGKDFEKLVRESSPAPECPDCHSTELHKKLSAFAPLTGASSSAALPSPCQGCGNANGPGSCQFGRG